MILRYHKFLESLSERSSVGEVGEYFHNVLQDFCDMNSNEIKFKLTFNKEEDIRWVIIRLWSETSMENKNPPFTTKEIFPTISRILNWSIQDRCNIDRYTLTQWPNVGDAILVESNDCSSVFYVTDHYIQNPMNFEYVGRIYNFELKISWD